MNRRSLFVSAAAAVPLTIVPSLVNARLIVPERKAWLPMSRAELEAAQRPYYLRPIITSRATADARLSALMDAVGCRAFNEKGALVRSRSRQPLTPLMAGNNGEDYGSYSDGWSNDGDSIVGYVEYQYPASEPTSTQIIWGGDYATFTTLGDFVGSTFYPSTPPRLPAHPACLPGSLAAAYTAAQAMQRIVSQNYKLYGQAVSNFVKMFGTLATTNPIAFLEGIGAVAASPEFLSLLGLCGVALAVYLVWKACFGE